MPDIIEVSHFDKFMAMFTGPSGGGKSIAIGSWRERGSVYYFDFDGRMASVASWHKSRGLKQGQLVYDTYGPDNLFDAFQKIKSFVQEGCPYETIVIDSFTALTVSAVMFSLNRRMGKGTRDQPTTTKGDMIVPDWDEYKGETVFATMMLDYSKTLAARGIHVIWTAHPITSTKIEAKPGESGEKYSKQTRYACYGQKTDSLTSIYFDEVYHFTIATSLEDGRKERVCLTQPYGEIGAKTALPLPSKIIWTDKDFFPLFKDNLGGVVNEVIKEGKPSPFAVKGR